MPIRTQNLDVLENNYLHGSRESKKIILKTIDSIYAVTIKDIVRCEAEAKLYPVHFKQRAKNINIETLERI
jgi:hypothetical protein